MKRTKQIRLLAVSLAISVIFAAAAPRALADKGGIRPAKDKVEGEYIVVFKDDVRDLPDVAAEMAKQHGGRVKRVWQNAVRGFHIVIPEGRALALSKDPRVAWVEENAQMFPSSTQSTKTGPPSNATTSDNRLWHLDRIDGSSPAGDNAYNYCTDGTDVNIYIVDSGVYGSHGEFGTRVQTGFNATDDPNPANQPCGASIAAVVNTSSSVEKLNWANERTQGGHGTSVASMAAGANVGVAKGATIIPVKVARCDGYEARGWLPNHTYQVNDRVQSSYQYIVTTAGTSGATEPSWPPNSTPLTTDGDDPGNNVYSTLVWQKVSVPAYMTSADVTSGLDWIVDSSANPDASERGVVNMSFYSEATGADLTAFEVAVDSLVDAGFIVIAAANNQNQDACNQSPARMSRENPTTALRNGVITVGGTMIRNTTEVTSGNQSIFRGNAGGGPFDVGQEPVHDSTLPVKDARWICAEGDSSKCGGNPMQPGSNYGPCLTAFAPAKNITTAIQPVSGSYRDKLGNTLSSSTSYRDRLGRWDDVPESGASGTSFSAPIVAGIAALFLQHAPSNVTSDDFYRALQLNGVSGIIEDSTAFPLSPDPLKPSPNLIARAVGVYAYSDPTSHTVKRNHNVTLNFSASGPGTLSYVWYRGPVGNVGQSVIVNTTSSGAVTFAPATDGTFTYWVRATSSSCSNIVNYVDSGAFNVTVNAPTIAAPAAVSAKTSSSGTTVDVTWGGLTEAVGYVVERSTSYAGPYTAVATVQGTTYSDVPPSQNSPLAYVYRVVAKDAGNNLSAPSGVDYATVRSSALFTDALVSNSTYLKGSHLTELRQAVDAVRVAAGLSTVNWPALDTLLVSDFSGIRTALDAARTQMQLAAYPYSSSITAQVHVNTLHLDEMRQSVR